MSVYSGFATRQLEQLYNTIVKKVISLLTERLLQYIHNESVDEKKWAQKILKIYKAQQLVEKKKYMQPYFSQDLDQLISTLQNVYKILLSEDGKQPSTLSLNMSFQKEIGTAYNSAVKAQNNDQSLQQVSNTSDKEEKKVSPVKNLKIHQHSKSKFTPNSSIYNINLDDSKHQLSCYNNILAVSSSRESPDPRPISTMKNSRCKTPMMYTQVKKKSNKRIQYQQQQQENVDPSYSETKPHSKARKITFSNKLSPQQQTHIKLKASHNISQMNIKLKRDFETQMKHFKNVSYVKKDEFPSYKDVDFSKRTRSRQIHSYNRNSSQQTFRNKDIDQLRKLEPLFPSSLLQENQSMNKDLQDLGQREQMKVRKEDLDQLKSIATEYAVIENKGMRSTKNKFLPK